MRSSTTTYSAAALLLAALAKAQTFTDCNPLSSSSCPTDPALGTTITTDFTKGADSFWSLAEGTTLTYGANGAIFTINTATDAPTISSEKYIFFGKVDVELLAAPGVGIVSSFILESDDLDEIDWEWLGSTDSSVESNFFGKGNTTTYDRAIYQNVATPIETWHTYTIDWDSSAIKWSIDGTLVRTLNYGDPLALGGSNYPQTPMRVKMGSWVGCASAADNQPSSPVYGTCQWAGGPVDFTNAPFNMLVRTVTIQDYGCATSYEYGDESGSYESIKSIGSCAGGSSVAPAAGTSSTAASSPASSSTSSSTASSTTSTTSATTSTQSTTSSASTAASNSTSNAASTSAATTSTASTVSLSTSTSAGTTSASSTQSAPSQVTSNGASANKKSHFGILDVTFGVLGLGMGYFFM